MLLGSALSERPRVADAVGDAADRLGAQLGSAPDVVFVFASPRLRGDLADVPRMTSARFASPLVCGCTGEGVIGQGRERERAPALAMLGVTLPRGASARPLRVESGARKLDAGARPTGVIVLSDPFSADIEAMVRAFDASRPGVALVGAVASGARKPGGCSLFLEGWTFDDGAVGVSLSGSVRLDAIVTQGYRPIGEPMIVTRADGPRILELDRGRPLDVLRQLGASLGGDPSSIGESLLCGVQMRDTQLEYGPGDFLVRSVIGVERDRGALVIGARLEGYPVVQLYLRDGTASANALAGALASDREAHGEALGGLLFSCVERGAALYGESDRESRVITECHGALPVAGFFANAEIAPVRGATYVHGHASVLAMLRETKRGPTR